MSVLPELGSLAALQNDNADASINANNTAPTPRGELGQQQFLELMLAQLKHQDPMKPLENGEFVAQMAQFSTVAGIEEMNASMQQLANRDTADRLLQAATLIGKTITAPVSATTLVADEPLQLKIIPPAATGGVTLSIHDANGQQVYQQAQSVSGIDSMDFSWDQQLPDGSTASAVGEYTLSAEYSQGETTTSLPVHIETTVTSVGTSPPDGTLLIETSHRHRLALDNVTQIGE